ncbi:MAG: ECF-type sigma factor [Acidobacteriota bacterium]
MASRATTDYLLAWSGGDETALAPLMEKVHLRLVGLASTLLQGERDNHTLDAAALVNEAFLRLIQQQRVGWQDRAHFFAIAAKMMRRILVDHARRRQSEKRGREVLTLQIDDLDSKERPAGPELTAIDQAVWELESRDPELAEIVVMKYFGGMSRDEIAEVLTISSATVSRRWRTARAWLFEYLK